MLPVAATATLGCKPSSFRQVKLAARNLEAFLGLQVIEVFLRQKLYGNSAIQPGVLPLVDDTHAAAANLLNNLVMRDRFPDQELLPSKDCNWCILC
jgi:hypothetical protein